MQSIQPNNGQRLAIKNFIVIQSIRYERPPNKKAYRSREKASKEGDKSDRLRELCFK